MTITDLMERDFQKYVCSMGKYDGLAGVEVLGPITLGRFERRAKTEDERIYISEIDRLAEAHLAKPNGTRYVLHTNYFPPYFPPHTSNIWVTASLCELGEMKRCRQRSFKLDARLHPALAARIVFEDIMRANTDLRSCRRDPR